MKLSTKLILNFAPLSDFMTINTTKNETKTLYLAYYDFHSSYLVRLLIPTQSEW